MMGTALELLVFYVFAAFAVGGALIAAFTRKLVYSVFALLLTFVGVAGLYLLLSADFLAVVQIMLYAGGILVLMIFGVMLTHRIADVSYEHTFSNVPTGGTICLLLWATLIGFVCQVPWRVMDPLPPFEPTTRAIGVQFLGDYLVPFEYSSVVLLVVVLGAAMLSRKEVD